VAEESSKKEVHEEEPFIVVEESKNAKQ